MPENIRYLTSFDIFLLVSIYHGVNSCTHLAAVTGKSKQTISDNVARLIKIGLVISQEQDQKHFYVLYDLTDTTKEFLESSWFDINQNYLATLKSRATVR